MKAYCINLDRRSDRLEHMTAEFARAGVPFERIPAVDGQDPEVMAEAAKLPESFHKVRMGVGAYGCLQSHRVFWQRLVDSGDAWGMVFEDDLLLASGMGALLVGDWIPSDADIVKLETFRIRVHVSAGCHPVGTDRKTGRLHSTHLGTGAYAVSAAMARRLLVETENTGDPVDEFLFNAHLPFFATARIYQMIPAPVLQGDRAGATKKKLDTGWQATSITERHFAGKKPAGRFGETSLQRLWRRGREELRARLKGTRYIVVPHG